MRCFGTLMRVGIVSALFAALTVPAWAVQPGAATRRAKTATTTAQSVVKSVRGAHLWSVTLTACPTAPCTVTVYDAATADTTATLKFEAQVASNNGTFSEAFAAPIVTTNGLYVVTDPPSGSRVIVSYE